MGKDLGNTAFIQHEEEFEGFYRGQVVENNDPLLRGRLRIQVLPMFVGVAANTLPWAIPANPLFSGAGTGTGTFTVPDMGTWVWCFFERGQWSQPVYFAEASDGVHGVPIESQTNYPTRRVTHTKAGVVLYVDDTTKTIVAKTPAGNQIKIDDATNTITLTHQTGMSIQIDPTGQIILTGTNIIVNTTGTTTWNGTGTINVNASSGVNVLAAGTITLQGPAINLNT